MEHPHDEARAGGNGPRPPVAPEPVRVRIDIPLFTVVDDAQEHEAGKAAKDTERDGVCHERPEPRRLSDRACDRRFAVVVHSEGPLNGSASATGGSDWHHSWCGCSGYRRLW